MYNTFYCLAVEAGFYSKTVVFVCSFSGSNSGGWDFSASCDNYYILEPKTDFTELRARLEP